MSNTPRAPNYCATTDNRMDQKIIAQTIFLGASVMDFNCNLGWGTQPSTLTVNLVNDNSAGIVINDANSVGIGCEDLQHDENVQDGAYQNEYYHANNTSTDGFDIYRNKDNNTCTIRDATARVKAKVYYRTTYPDQSSGDDEDSPPWTRDESSLQVEQDWWNKKDPGFLGDANNIKFDGTVQPFTAIAGKGYVSPFGAGDGPDPLLSPAAGTYFSRGYNITNCPVYFKMLDFSFGGFIQSWKKNKSNGGDVYTVVINSSQSILNTCTVILDKYGGSLAGSLDSFDWSAPGNYVGDLLKYNTTNISYGNIPNIFNVYGFLESFGPQFFGSSSYKVSDGFLATQIIDGLRILTGADDITKKAPGDNLHSEFGPKNAFSPFGRILAPVAHDPITGEYITTNKWGLIAPTDGKWTGNKRCNFRLDLSELANSIAGSDKKIKADSMSISELIDQICDDHGLDWTTSMINTPDGWVIKIIAVTRRFAPLVNGVKSTVSKLVCDDYPVGSFSYGKETNDAASRSLVIGPNQQRLYQAKSTRLAYTQSSYIFCPAGADGDGSTEPAPATATDNWRFIDYYQLGRISLPDISSVDCLTDTGARESVNSTLFHYGKVKFPAFYSTRNPILDERVTSLKNDEAVKGEIELKFNDRDSNFEDSELVHDPLTQNTQIRSGNYRQSQLITHGTDARFALDPCGGDDDTLKVANADINNIGEQTSITNRRFFPLYRDVVCPFFGYLLEDRYKIDAQNENTDFRRIRPVWYDFWTGQICVLFHKSELPKTRIGLKGRYTSYTLNRQSSVSMVSSVIDLATADPEQTAAPDATATSTPEAPPDDEEEVATPSYEAEWFIITESEFRSAMAGKDSFASYTLGKIYKTDTYVMLHSAYVERSKQHLMGEGYTAEKALELALKQNDWSWGYLQENFCGPEGAPGGDEVGSSTAMYKLPSEARKDLDLVCNFIKSVGQEFYGRQYMVMAPYLQSKTQTEPYKFNLQTDLGDIKVFKGGGEIRYNYEPCANDNGAWEEYGNQIDDNIICGDNNWATLTNDKGQINPILGYNATLSFDYFRYQLAQKTILNANNVGDPLDPDAISSVNPYFTYSAWDDAEALVHGDGASTKNKYYFENLLLSDLARDAGNFVMVDCLNNGPLSNAKFSDQDEFESPDTIEGLDAFGRNHGAPKRKLYKTCNVSPKFSFLDPEKMLDARMIVSTEALRLNNSSEQYQTDPSNTVSATIGMEDVAIYTRAGGRRASRLRFLSRFFSPYIDTFNSLQSMTAVNDNSTGRNTKISPKCAHPFFAGIPIKSNTYCYGPWTNYPALLDSTGIFTTGKETEIRNPNTDFNVCYDRAIDLPTSNQKHLLIDNFITDTKFEINSDFAPWNFAGMSALDDVATKYVSGSVNYQTNIEVGSLDIAGIPLFNLGGSFNENTTNKDLVYTEFEDTYTFKDVKEGSLFSNNFPELTNINEYMAINDPGYISGDIVYKVPSIAIKDKNGNRLTSQYFTQAPILTNIMTSMGQNGISTKYSFRTYTRKLSLFDRQDIERSKKMAQQNMLRKKEIGELQQTINNNQFADNEAIKRAQNFNNTDDSAVPTFGTSPVTTIVCNAVKTLPKFSGLDESGAVTSTFSSPSRLTGSDVDDRIVRLAHTNDPGGSGHLAGGFTQQTSLSQIPFLHLEHRVDTHSKIYPDSELGDALKDSWGGSSIMSLDGIFSPISFYPTHTKSTYSISKYNENSCPICHGNKKIVRTYKKYKSSANTSSEYSSVHYYCDSCVKPYEKLNAQAYGSTTTTSEDGKLWPPYVITTGNGLEELRKFNAFMYQKIQRKNKTDRLGLSLNIPINITTLQPIVMPQHEFKNANAQNYSGAHPDNAHPALKIAEKDRSFVDKGRNSISIVGRGSIYKDIMGAGFNASNNISQPGGKSSVDAGIRNYDYDYLDSRFSDRFSGTHYTNLKDQKPEQNMRFVGIRGPMMLHGWGYDSEGYPVPNACDEPFDIDQYGRPKRFKRVRSVNSTSSFYKNLSIGEPFVTQENGGVSVETAKLQNIKLQNDTEISRGGLQEDITQNTEVWKVTYYDDMSDSGGYHAGTTDDPEGYCGSIISKTQKYINSTWTKKIKLKQFYLNWAERPDLWPVGPVDLRWDADRQVWAQPSPKVYKDVYITLEEDMVKDPDLDETFAARGFYDDVSYSNNALADNLRKLVYVKDRAGYTAPRGAKLYCRYDTDTGYYEPIAKQQFIVYGTIASGTTTATIKMSYVQGKKRGDTSPTMSVSFKNPLGFSTTSAGVGMFSYIDGYWTLISIS